jgi:hypothetical protein
MIANEIALLLQTTENGPDRYGMTGPARAMLYRLAAETGIAGKRTAALRVSDFDLAGRAVTLAAEIYQKSKRGQACRCGRIQWNGWGLSLRVGFASGCFQYAPDRTRFKDFQKPI